MTEMRASRMLSIGEFAAATQLSQKALRIYDDQGLLRPARIDAVSGYRYYASEQVSLGRLIRALREMNLPLADIAKFVAADESVLNALFEEAGAEIDKRYAGEKRAYQNALLLRRSNRAASLTVAQSTVPAMVAAVFRIVVDRTRLIERARIAEAFLQAQVGSNIDIDARTYCSLLDPPSDEEGRVDVRVPILDGARHDPESGSYTVRTFSAVTCAAVALDLSRAQIDFAAYTDGLFDWFDRNGLSAVDVPTLALPKASASGTELLWAYEESLK